MAYILGNLWKSYNSSLQRQPLVTKSITSGVLYGVGDIFAQMADSYNNKKPLKLDWKRVGVISFYGTIIAGPLYHYWFAYLDTLPVVMLQVRYHRQARDIIRAANVLRRHGVHVGDLGTLPEARPYHKYTIKAAKILADQLIFSSAYTGVFFLSVGFMNGLAGVGQETPTEFPLSSDDEARLPTDVQRTIASLRAIRTEENAATLDALILKVEKDASSKRRQTLSEIVHHTWEHTKKVYPTTYLVDCIVWPPLQFINFSYVPVRLQVLFVNVANLGWNTFLSLMANSHH